MAEATKSPSQSSTELQKLRAELLRLIVKNNDARARRVPMPR
ncbi:MAG TPA: hypothetical protein VGG64_27310 [Pirellulales bacterium]|jgi:hypothetical protein